MSRFLSLIPVNTAREKLFSLGNFAGIEYSPLQESLGRILSKDIFSDVDIPGFDRSSVDGYAVRSRDTIGAGESIPSMLKLSGHIPMGVEPEGFVNSGECYYVPTGGFLPKGADAMVMIEHCEELGNEVLVHRSVAPGENIVYKGEDFSTQKPAVKAGTRISSRVMGVLAACGVIEVPVSKKPIVAVISTGNEIVSADTLPPVGKIRDVNTYLCSGFISESGGEPRLLGIIPDNEESLSQAIDEAVSCSDLILISGGSSKGERDICADIIERKGKVLVHGIALSPGKPTIIGRINEKPIIGLPGHPASAYVILIALVKDLMHVMTGEEQRSIPVTGLLQSPVPSARGREDYIRVTIEGEKITPVFGKSGLTNTLISSDGLLRIPEMDEGFEAGSKVNIDVWREG